MNNHNSCKNVLISGASSGIGLAICKRLLESGSTVTGVSRRQQKNSDITDHKHYRHINIDLSGIDDLPGTLLSLAKENSTIDTIICCAGKGRFGSLEEFSFEQIRQMMDLNFLSQSYIVRALMPVLKKQPNANIIFIGSESALSGSQKGSVYCASKFALRGFAQALREECSRSNVRVTIINPGMVKTPFFDELDFEPGSDNDNFIEPDDVAEAVTMVLSSRPQTVFDEINLSPLKKVVRKKPG